MKACAENFIKYLDSKNYHYSSREDNDGDVIVDFPYSGKVAKLVFSGDDGEYASLYMQYEHVPEDKRMKLIEVCNDLNCRFKWVTFFVDQDQDLMLQVDAKLSADTAADETMELMARMFNIADKAKSDIMKAIYA